jgi:hypothetical protein
MGFGVIQYCTLLVLCWCPSVRNIPNVFLLCLYLLLNLKVTIIHRLYLVRFTLICLLYKYACNAIPLCDYL